MKIQLSQLVEYLKYKIIRLVLKSVLSLNKKLIFRIKSNNNLLGFNFCFQLCNQVKACDVWNDVQHNERESILKLGIVNKLLHFKFGRVFLFIGDVSFRNVHSQTISSLGIHVLHCLNLNILTLLKTSILLFLHWYFWTS